MLTTIRNETGQIMASCEWWMVNQSGMQDWTNDGLWVRVEWLEISRGQVSQRIIAQVIENIAMRAPLAIGAFWKGSDDPKRELMRFTRQRLLAQTYKGGVRI